MQLLLSTTVKASSNIYVQLLLSTTVQVSSNICSCYFLLQSRHALTYTAAPSSLGQACRKEGRPVCSQEGRSKGVAIMSFLVEGGGTISGEFGRIFALFYICVLSTPVGYIIP